MEAYQGYCIETGDFNEPNEVRFPLAASGIRSGVIKKADTCGEIDNIAIWHSQVAANKAMKAMCPKGESPLVYGGLCVERIRKTMAYNLSAQNMVGQGCYEWMD